MSHKEQALIPATGITVDPTASRHMVSDQQSGSETGQVSSDDASDNAELLTKALGSVTPALMPATTLIRLDEVRANPLYTGIDGTGMTVVVIDSGADLDHPAYGPDANRNGIADRILFQYDFYGANDANAGDGIGHGTHVTGFVGADDKEHLGIAPGSALLFSRSGAIRTASLPYRTWRRPGNGSLKTICGTTSPP